MNELQAYFSNRIEILYHELKHNLFNSHSFPFTRRMLVVPSPAMKSWLMMKLATDPEIAIATGLEISYLDATIQKIQALSQSEVPSKQLNHLELALAIEKEIYHQIFTSSKMSADEYQIWFPLFDYLKVSNASLTQKNASRLTSLSDSLASLFVKYGKYAGRLVQQWELSETKNWQILLWKKLFHIWDYPYKGIHLINGDKQQLQFSRKDIQIHLFAISHMPDQFFDYFTNVSHQLPVYSYVLSPCHSFWSDLSSDKNSSFMIKSLQKKEIAEEQIEALREYLIEKNSLLANLGKLGQKMAAKIEESLPQSKESYIGLESIVHSSYEEFFIEDLLIEPSDHSLTMLEALQTDLLLSRNPDNTSKVLIPLNDQSIQLHSAPNRMREMQILYDTLLSITQSHQNNAEPIYPSDILIMCPDIESYAPYIKAVFENEESCLKVQIFDQTAPAESLILQSFMHLLSLPSSRWDVTTLLQLFEYPAFQKRHKLGKEELDNIREWIKICGVRWGINSDHRNDILKRDFCLNNMVEESQTGTWDYAIGRIVSGLVMNLSSIEEIDNYADVIPLTMDYSKELFLGKWANLLRSLKQDLKCLHDGTFMSFADWGKYLSALYEGYFLEEEADKIDVDVLKSYFEQLQQAENKLGKSNIPFSTVYHYLKAHLNKPVENYRDGDVNAIKFCAMLPMRAIPSQIVGLIGLSENSYPRQEVTNSLNLMHQSPLADYCPSQADYDRFLFLEAILSARKYFISTYCGYSAEDGKSQPPSLLLTELLSYTDKAFTYDEAQTDVKPSEKILLKHPFHAFDKAYFSGLGPFKSFSKQQYLAAKAFYRIDKSPITNFISSFPRIEAEGQDKKEVIQVSIKELVAFAKNPLKSYFNKTLGIYLEKLEDKILKNEEEFQLSHLQNFMMKKTALQHSTSSILKRADQLGHLPVGPFKAISLEKFTKEVNLIQSHLSDLNVAKTDIFQVHISNRFTQVEQNSQGDWQLPSLIVSCQGAMIELTGTLQEVSSQGLIARIKDDKSDVIKVWPEYLIYCLLVERNKLPWQPHLLLVNGKKAAMKQPFFEGAALLLEQYLEYYFIGKQCVSPLIPEWVPDLVTDDYSAFQIKIEQSLTNRFQPLYNEYLHWAARNTLIPDAESIFTYWQPTAKRLFSDLFNSWFSSLPEGQSKVSLIKPDL